VFAFGDDAAAEEGCGFWSGVGGAEARVENPDVAAVEMPFEIAIVVVPVDTCLRACFEVFVTWFFLDGERRRLCCCRHCVGWCY
jgi:hypothetical protein